MDEIWTKWVMQTSRDWNDLDGIVKLTGIYTIDADHKQIIGYLMSINSFLDSMRHSRFDAALIENQKALLINLYNFIKKHFEREERLIKSYALKHADKQTHQHHHILDQIKKTIVGFQTGRLNVNQKLKYDMLDWIINHINEVDFETFKVDSFHHCIEKAKVWDDIEIIVHQTGLEALDEQRRAIIEATLQILELTQENEVRSLEPVGLALFGTEISKYEDMVRRHFSYEEQLMRKFHLEALHSQRQAHEAFLETLNQLQVKAHQKVPRIFINLRTDLLDWWIRHINCADFEAFNAGKIMRRLLNEATQNSELHMLLKRTRIDLVDRDHIGLIDIIYELCHEIDLTSRSSGPTQKGKALFEKLYHFSGEHFAREEQLMKDLKLEVLAGHQEKHHHLTQELIRYYRYFEKGQLASGKVLRQFLIKWLTDHTNRSDYEALVGTERSLIMESPL
jgi:hemerythrin